ncbi:alpha/beta hydrolase [Nocardiopsis sp. FIRDI 009]|uniref:alpha/beta hydrolase n=1 Tax=Nocardiopsis sp. FIRDI 009 TaxID=714197 RepID=UPI001E507347|nr:alpha/beta hydrolase [Nocardiopsis sp. FIRDI 009]
MGAGTVAAVTALVSGCVPTPGEPEAVEAADAAAVFAGQTIDWSACYDDEQIDELVEWGSEPDWVEALECGTVTVPLDYDRPDGRTLDLAVVRAPAQGSTEERVGSLVVNPGGPGVTGLDMLDFPSFSDQIRASFDLVSFDPRGVGESGGFACGNWTAMAEARQGFEGTDPADLTGADLRPLEEAARAYADDCVDTVGEDFLAHIGTVNVVRDLDVLRDALGDERLTYVGYSYGTYIGALYAQTYPDNTRALVLDGAVETDRPNVEVAYDQAVGFQDTWELFAEDCAATDDACPFTGADDADAAMADIMAALDREAPVVEGVTIDGATLVSMIGMELYYEESWDYLADLLAAVDTGDAEATDHYLGYLYENTYGLYADEESVELKPGEEELDAEAALTAINCADRDDPTDIFAYRDAVDRASEVSPLFGADLVWEQLPCAYWPDTEEAPTGFTAPDAPPVVVVGTVGDPATPYTWAEELAGQLETATLVTYEGAGHTLYGNDKSACVDEPVDAYLLTGEAPEADLSCPAVA